LHEELELKPKTPRIEKPELKFKNKENLFKHPSSVKRSLQKPT